MADRKRHVSRTEQRASIRKHIGGNLKVWPMGLESNLSRISRLAGDEWNFEKFYEQVRRFAGGAVTREMVQEFMKAKGISIKSRPRGGGKVL